jgi:hypothetical protein
MLRPVLLDRYEKILEGHQPFVVATPKLIERMNLSPLGKTVEHVYSCLHMASGPFLDLIQHLDSRCYAARRLRMPRWAFYDCGELPGAIIGLGRPARGLSPELRAALDVAPTYEGLVPVTMYVAIPMLEKHHWLGHTITSIHEVIDGGVPSGSRILTIAIALSALRAKRATSSTQWASAELDSIAHFAPLTVMAAWVPQHDHPGTCVLRCEVDEARILAGLSEPPAAPKHNRMIDPNDERALIALQKEIEAGSRVAVAGPPFYTKGDTMVPIAYEEVRP